MIATIDGRLLDADRKWNKYRRKNNIEDVFQKERELWNKHVKTKKTDHGTVYTIPDDSDKLCVPRAEKDEYLRREHTFLLWDYHTWMPWEKFEWYLSGENYADTSIYMPCDAADRQCNMACKYFNGNCPRIVEELICPIPNYMEDNDD